MYWGHPGCGLDCPVQISWTLTNATAALRVRVRDGCDKDVASFSSSFPRLKTLRSFEATSRFSSSLVVAHSLRGRRQFLAMRTKRKASGLWINPKRAAKAVAHAIWTRTKPSIGNGQCSEYGTPIPHRHFAPQIQLTLDQTCGWSI